MAILHENKYLEINDQKSKFFYDIILNKEIIKPSRIKKFWSEKFDLTLDDKIWENIFENKVKNVHEKKISVFNFKLLHNIIPCGYIVNKWNHQVSSQCNICNTKHDISHMIFDCINVKDIWMHMEDILNVKISYMKVVLGYSFHSKTKNTMFLDYLIAIVAFCAYKHWLQCNMMELT